MVHQSKFIDIGNVILRPLVKGDVQPLAELANDKKIASMMTGMPHPFSIGDAQSFLLRAQASDPLEKQIFAITRKSDGALLGCCGLSIKADHVLPELAYWVGQKYWGNGYGSNAVSGLINHALSDFGFTIVRAGCRIGNFASEKILRKHGFWPCETTMETISSEQQKAPILWYQYNKMTFRKSA